MGDDTTLPTAALRDFSAVYDRYGSIASDRHARNPRAMSASLQKRRSDRQPALVEWSGENPGPARMLRERLSPGPELENDQGSQSRMSAFPASRHWSHPQSS